MPRLRKTDYEKFATGIAARIKYHQVLCRANTNTMAGIIGRTPQTYTARMRHPGGFTIDELYSIARFAGVSVEDLIGKNEPSLRND